MKFLSLTIQNYRALKGPLTISLEKESLLPIIGVNECGKTTILHAILAFDCYNDELNHGGRHLQDVDNLYETTPEAPEIMARVAISKREYQKCLKEVLDLEEVSSPGVLKRLIRKRSPFPNIVEITRNLKTKEYTLAADGYDAAAVNDDVARSILSKLPFILYFDDFQDSIEERIEISHNDENDSDWLAILETLFSKTNEAYSVHDLSKKEERQRKTILSKVTRKLNTTLTNEWRNFQLDDSEALEISIEYSEETYEESARSYLKFDIVETDANGDKHFFFVRDRSKGFYWFFNFVMKLEFNPKVAENGDVDAIYILDEPGSYLHAVAQERLCKKLRQLSQENKVIYCTHSHHLLNPEVVPLSSVRIASKDSQGISLTSIYDYDGSMTDVRVAYQPIMDALQVRPFSLELNKEKTIIVEGMVDYSLLELFSSQKKFKVIPSVGAGSMKFFISLLIAWRVPYSALWDNDDEGRQGHEEATRYFGEDEAESHFFLLPLKGKRKKRIMQNLVDGEELRRVRDRLKLPDNCSFDKTIFTLYYSENRDRIVSGDLMTTRRNIEELYHELGIV